MLKYGFQFGLSDQENIGAYANSYLLRYAKLLNPNLLIGKSNLFANCYSLKQVEFGNPPVNIPNNFCYNCYNLTKIHLPKDCTIGTNAFFNCYNLYPIPT